MRWSDSNNLRSSSRRIVLGCELDPESLRFLSEFGVRGVEGQLGREVEGRTIDGPTRVDGLEN